MNDMKKVINATMKDHLASQSWKIIIYLNMHNKIVHLGKKVEDHLEIDEAAYLIDLVILHGHLTRNQKAWSYLKRFVAVSNTTTINHDVWILCATSGFTNAGIDSKHVYCAVRAKFPPSIQDMCQEKGWVGRIPSTTPDIFTYLVCFLNVGSFVLLLCQTLNPEEKMTQTYRNSMLKDHIQVAQFFTSIHACFNHFFEVTLSNQFQYDSNTPLVVEQCNHCLGCTDKLQHLYGRVVRDVGQEILFSAFMSASKYKIGDLVLFFLEHYNLDHRLFTCNWRTVPKQEINRFIFQLIAWEILIPKYKVEGGGIYNPTPPVPMLACRCCRW